MPNPINIRELLKTLDAYVSYQEGLEEGRKPVSMKEVVATHFTLYEGGKWIPIEYLDLPNGVSIQEAHDRRIKYVYAIRGNAFVWDQDTGFERRNANA